MFVIKVTDRKTGRIYQAIVNDTTGELVIGRSRKCPIRLTGDTVSGNHLKIVYHDGKLMIEDLKSVNGTYINGIKLNGSAQLKPGEQVNIGIGDALLYIDGKYL